jgi:hypothetical protein
MKNIILLILPVLFSCNAQKTASTTSGNINSSAPYKWTTSFPRTVRISQQFTDEEAAAIKLMSDAWSDSVDNEKNFFTYGPDASEKTNNLTNLDSLYDGVMGLYKSSNWPNSLPGSALAVTQIFGRRYNTGESNEFVNIEHADIIVNDDFYDFDTTDSGSGFDFRTVFLHELGHFLGLQHKSSSSNRNLSVMFPSIDPTEAKRYPKAQDISDVADKYEISIGGAGPMSAGNRIKYTIKEGDKGSAVKILLELHANGDCVHKENGREVSRHR